jgi:hypothetical protein
VLERQRRRRSPRRPGRIRQAVGRTNGRCRRSGGARHAAAERDGSQRRATMQQRRQQRPAPVLLQVPHVGCAHSVISPAQRMMRATAGSGVKIR